nr:MAG TPA: hypothetical protein [Bacteriophage sp.]
MHFIPTSFTYHIIHINHSLVFYKVNCRNLRFVYHHSKNSYDIFIK